MTRPAAAPPLARHLAAAARAVALRTPLARIQLVAGRLARLRDAASAAPRDSADDLEAMGDTLNEAVLEIDRGIGEALAILVPRPSRDREAEAHETVESVRTRVAPALAARGVAWLPAEPDAVRAAPASWLREAAVALAQDAAGSPAAGGRCIRIEAVGAPPHATGLRLAMAGEDGGLPAFAAAQALALRLGGRVERTAAGGATLWFPASLDASQGDLSCGAS